MKIASLRHGGEAKVGILRDDDRIAVLAPGSNGFGVRDFLRWRLDNAGAEWPVEGVLPLGEVALLPAVPDPAKILCIATNYCDAGLAGKPEPARPLIFTRFADAQVGHGAALQLPDCTEQFDFEGELAVIIGRPAHRVGAGQAMDHVAGYACFNDGSARDWQKHSSQFTAGKNFPATAGFGPWLVTADEVPDPQALDLEVRVNGEVMQQISTDRMIFPVASLIEYISRFTPLGTGDVIVTGTPTGFGSTRTPPRFLSAGDVVEVEISQVGLLRNEVAAERLP